jgi:uncharacterized protein affecting Mg2+/Co2+ transport
MKDLPSSIVITVISEYLDLQSAPERNRFAFAYHIKITNQALDYYRRQSRPPRGPWFRSDRADANYPSGWLL